jgi:hypothetical protein
MVPEGYAPLYFGSSMNLFKGGAQPRRYRSSRAGSIFPIDFFY